MDLYNFKLKQEIVLDREKFLDFYNQLKDCQDLTLLKQKIVHFKNWALSNHSISEESAIYCSYESLLEIIKKNFIFKNHRKSKVLLEKTL
jgi:hypothetical protein